MPFEHCAYERHLLEDGRAASALIGMQGDLKRIPRGCGTQNESNTTPHRTQVSSLLVAQSTNWTCSTRTSSQKPPTNKPNTVSTGTNHIVAPDQNASRWSSLRFGRGTQTITRKILGLPRFPNRRIAPTPAHVLLNLLPSAPNCSPFKLPQPDLDLNHTEMKSFKHVPLPSLHFQDLSCLRAARSDKDTGKGLEYMLSSLRIYSKRS